MLEIQPLFAFLPSLSGYEMIIIVVFGILLFGKRLPEVARSLGKGVVEFKKGLQGIEEDIHDSSKRSIENRTNDRIQADAPRFEIPAKSESNTVG